MTDEEIAKLEEEYELLKVQFEELSSQKTKAWNKILAAKKAKREANETSKSKEPSEYEQYISNKFGMIDTHVLLNKLGVAPRENVIYYPDVFNIEKVFTHTEKLAILLRCDGLRNVDISNELGLSSSRVSSIFSSVNKKIRHPKVGLKLIIGRK